MTVDTIPAAHDEDGRPLSLPILYKITASNGRPVHGGSGQWDLPKGGKPGAWWDIEGPIKPCANALHVTDAENFDKWYPGHADGLGDDYIVHRVEVRGLAINAGNKWAVQSARLLPHSGIGAVDLTPLEDAALLAGATLDAVRVKADDAYRAAIRKAERAERAVKVPPGWASYIIAVGESRIPKGHPARPYAESVGRIGAAERAAARKRDETVAPFLETARATHRALAEARKANRLAGI